MTERDKAIMARCVSFAIVASLLLIFPPSIRALLIAVAVLSLLLIATRAPR
jgi:hypothetical protein